MKKLRIKAKEKKGIVTVKCMAKHAMLSYDQAAKKGKKANFITHMTGTVNGETVFEMSSSQFLSKDPFMKFAFKGTKGDKLVMKAVDLSGDSVETSKKIK
jgi:sulfur-oxidizing protein SoxZ